MAQSKTRSRSTAKLKTKAQTKPATTELVVIETAKTPVTSAKPFVYWRNERSYVLQRGSINRLIAEITSNPQQSVRYYARVTGMSPDQVNCAIERNQKVRKLARDGLIAVMDRGRRPAWYHEMAIAQQKLVPMVSREEQYVAIAEDVLPSIVQVDDEVVREDSELATKLFNRILARTSMTNATAMRLANEMLEIVQHNAEVASSAKREIQALAQSANSITLRLNSPTQRIAAE